MLFKTKKRSKACIKIGNTLKSLRLQNGFSVKCLSSMLNDFNYPISDKTIYKWESNKTIPDIKSLNILAKIYNVGLESFFESGSKIQALTSIELKLISYLHSYKLFKKVVLMLARLDRETNKYGK